MLQWQRPSGDDRNAAQRRGHGTGGGTVPQHKWRSLVECWATGSGTKVPEAAAHDYLIDGAGARSRGNAADEDTGRHRRKYMFLVHGDEALK